MKNKCRYDFREQVQIFKVLAHEVRLAIIYHLATKLYTVGELVSILDIEQSVISKHLGVLRLVGIVEDRRKGKRVEYRLAIPCVIDFLSCAVTVIRQKKKIRAR